MRILLLSNLYPPYVEGGAEILAADIAAQLTQRGHDVFVLTSSFGLPQAEQQGAIWRTLHFTPAAHFDRQRPLWQQLHLPLRYYQRYHSAQNAEALRRLVTEIHPDVLYIWEITGIGVTSLLKVLPAFHLPIVFHLGSYWLLYARSPDTAQSRLRTRWLKQRIIGTVPALTWTSLIAVSEAVKDVYAQAGFSPERIEVIYNGLDERFLSLPEAASASRHARIAANSSIQILFAGRIRAEKGILVLLRAADLLVQQGQSNLHVHIFGDGDAPYIEELTQFLQEKQLTSHVTFHGKVSQEELITHYDRSDIMLVPSLWTEPFGLVVAEAMARELPVIASHAGGPAEMITHGVDGLLVKPGDERALANAIQQLLADPAQRQRLGQAARKTVLTRFTITENGKRVERHLQKAIADHALESTDKYAIAR